MVAKHARSGLLRAATATHNEGPVPENHSPRA